MNLANDLEQIAILVLSALVLAFLGAAWRLFVRMRNQDIELAYIRQKLDAQFGTNGFVLKEQVRVLTKEIGDANTRMDDHLNLHIAGGT